MKLRRFPTPKVLRNKNITSARETKKPLFEFVNMVDKVNKSAINKITKNIGTRNGVLGSVK